MDKKTCLRVLITNTWLLNRTGSELYVYDVATALLRRGHKPIVYSPRLGGVAEDIRAATVPVIDNLDSMGEAPDLIHGQHHQETMTALLRFPDVPAVYFSHGWLPWQEAPPRFPRILRYVAVDDTVRDRLIYEHGIPPQHVTTILNFVDTNRFQPRSPLPKTPRHALAFSNTANEATYVNTLRQACSAHNLALDVVGLGNGNPTREPEKILGNYDIIFAKARAALESMTVGTAVILCDLAGAGPMVTMNEAAGLRRLNFGIRTLQNPLTSENIAQEIARYDATDATQVSQFIRENARMEDAIDQILNVYQETLAEWSNTQRLDKAEEYAAAARYQHWLGLSLPKERDHFHAEAERLTGVIHQLSADREHSQNEVSRLAHEVTQLTNEITRLTREIDELKIERMELDHERATLINELSIVRRSFVIRCIAVPIWRLRHWMMPNDSRRYATFRGLRQRFWIGIADDP